MHSVPETHAIVHLKYDIIFITSCSYGGNVSAAEGGGCSSRGSASMEAVRSRFVFEAVRWGFLLVTKEVALPSRQ
jgi:hypothetical protein